jgi:hypothetical protein
LAINVDGTSLASRYTFTRCGTTIQSEKSLRREIVNCTIDNVCCATGAVEAAFISNTALGRVALRKRKV